MKLSIFLFCIASACNSCKPKPSPPEKAAAAAAASDAATPLVGAVDPFAPLDDEAAKLLQKAFAADRTKKYDEAKSALEALLNNRPDYDAARWQLLRLLAKREALSEIPAIYRELVARDFLPYVHKLEQAKEFAALRAAPEWQAVQKNAEEYRAPTRAALGAGFFFVARRRAAKETTEGALTTIEPHQEAYHYDPASGRYERLTPGSGQVLAVHHAKNQLLFVEVRALERTDSGDRVVNPRVGVIDLERLETVGPFEHRGSFSEVTLGLNAAGQPLFTFLEADGKASTFTVDTARTGLGAVEGASLIPEGGETRAWATQVVHFEERTLQGVKLQEGTNKIYLEGLTQPIVASRPLTQSSLSFSPNRKRLTYAGRLDACRVQKGDKDKNELFVYDLEGKQAQRIAQAVSAFETLWLDDDRLVYEAGVAKDGRVHIYTFSTHSDWAMPTKHGAGLYGVPSLACEEVEANVDESLGPQETDDD
jgi:hypothetical protein